MEESSNINVEISRSAAQKAAQDAARHYQAETNQSARGKNGALALYIWGSLAAASAVYAVATGLFQDAGSGTPSGNIVADSLTGSQSKTNTEIALGSKDDGSFSPEFERLLSDVEQSSKSIDPQMTGAIEPTIGPIKDNVQIFPAPALTGKFAADIGGARDMSALAARYTAMKRRAPDLFASVEPRAIAAQSGQLDTTRLIAGPFSHPDQVAEFCRSIRLKLTVDCAKADYEGVPIYTENR